MSIKHIKVSNFNSVLFKGSLRALVVATLVFLAVLLFVQPVLACNITITPATAAGKVGDILTFTINVQQTHRRCLTPIDETEIKLQNMEMVSQTLWEKISSDTNSKKITVKLTKAGEGSLEVIRECSLGGDDQIIKITISEAAAQAAPPPTQPLPSHRLTQTPVQTTPASQSLPPSLPINQTATQPAVSAIPAESQTAAEISWGEAIAYAVRQPNIIAVFGFTAVSTVLLMRRYRRFRYLILLGALAYLGFFLGGCLCALGALQNVILRTGEIKYRFASYLILGIPVIAALFFGRVFCGWVCPMGAVQHFVFKKETSKKIRSFEPSPRLHNILRYVKYLVLLVLVVTVAVTRVNWFSSIDPFKALFNMDFTLIPAILIVVVLVLSIVIGFPWCRYVCPLGAFIALFGRFSLFKVKVNQKCTNCKACQTTFCDYRAIQPGESQPVVNQLECTRCGECVARCPSGALDFTRK